MKVRVTSAFATKFYEEWRLAGDAMVVSQYEGATLGEQKVRLERVLEVMAPDLARVLKHQLLEVLLADVASQQKSTSPTIPLDSAPVA